MESDVIYGYHNLETCNCYKYGKVCDCESQKRRKFKLQYKPVSAECIKFFINGVMYNVTSGSIKYIEDGNYIEWMWDASIGGFDIERLFHCMAVYEYIEDESISADNIENMLNSILFNGIEYFYNQTDSMEHIYPYLASQIYRENLTYKFVMNYVSLEIKEEIDLYMLSYSNKNRIPSKEINKLLLGNPMFLSNKDVQLSINKNILFNYIKEQITIGAIKEDELLALYPYMWKELFGKIE